MTTRGKFGYWVFATLTAVISVGMLAAGIGLVVRFALVNNPPAAIPASALPKTTPDPHAHCWKDHAGFTVPDHQLQIRQRDRRGFDLALQEFTHRQGGCSRLVSRFEYRVILPPAPMRQILELNRQNYHEWAIAALADTATIRNPNLTDRRQLDLHINQSPAGYAPDWMLTSGLFLAAFGMLACVGSLIICTETARYTSGAASIPSRL